MAIGQKVTVLKVICIRQTCLHQLILFLSDCTITVHVHFCNDHSLLYKLGAKYAYTGEIRINGCVSNSASLETFDPTMNVITRHVSNQTQELDDRIV